MLAPFPHKRDKAIPRHYSNSLARIPKRMNSSMHNCNIPTLYPPMDFRDEAVPDWIENVRDDGLGGTPLPPHPRHCKTICSCRHILPPMRDRGYHSIGRRMGGELLRRNDQRIHHRLGQTHRRRSSHRDQNRLHHQNRPMRLFAVESDKG